MEELETTEEQTVDMLEEWLDDEDDGTLEDMERMPRTGKRRLLPIEKR